MRSMDRPASQIATTKLGQEVIYKSVQHDDTAMHACIGKAHCVLHSWAQVACDRPGLSSSELLDGDVLDVQWEPDKNEGPSHTVSIVTVDTDLRSVHAHLNLLQDIAFFPNECQLCH